MRSWRVTHGITPVPGHLQEEWEVPRRRSAYSWDREFPWVHLGPLHPWGHQGQAGVTFHWGQAWELFC